MCLGSQFEGIVCYRGERKMAGVAGHCGCWRWGSLITSGHMRNERKWNTNTQRSLPFVSSHSSELPRQSSLEILLTGSPKDAPHQQVVPNLFMSHWDSIRDGEWGPSVSKTQNLSLQQLSSIFPFLPRPEEVFFYLMGWVSPEFSLCIPSNHFTSSSILSRKFWKTNPRSSDSQDILVLTRIINRNTW